MPLEIDAATLSGELTQRGYRAKIIPSDHIHDLQEEIESQHRQGFFNEEFYTEELGGFDFKIDDGFTESNSLIIVAAPQPPMRVTFKLSGDSFTCIIPPTYSLETDRQTQDMLELQLQPAGFRVKKADLPWKLLAVHSGLAQYGKNNITYVDGLGSYHRLVAFISDLPAVQDPWQAPRMLERCENCKACMKACPTGAITADRFLIKAERCLTFHNERGGKFPGWIKSSWHNCLVGCLYCQKACPVNKDVPGSTREGAEFTEKETALISRGKAQDGIPQEAIEKLKRMDMIEYLPVLGRNLNVLYG
ncbi:MAG: epoxyqueuosine reductase [Deltaproteobacteria bacterium]|nr:epoxyqueuosine reductase [Deltaproteobacteria bacterium]